MDVIKSIIGLCLAEIISDAGQVIEIVEDSLYDLTGQPQISFVCAIQIFWYTHVAIEILQNRGFTIDIILGA